MSAAPSRKVNWQVPVAWALCLAGLAILVAGSLLFVYQAIYSWVALAGGVNLDAASKAVPTWIRWALVDLSLVTPGLLLHVGYRLIRGCRDVLAAPASWVPVSTFPFPRAYKAFYVNMGLLGTLVGFVIAFQNPAASLQSQAIVLMESLGTAVWSSLTAVALAYGLCPMCELVAHLPFRRSDPIANPLAVLSASAASTAAALDQIVDSATKLGNQVDLVQLEQDLAVAKERVNSLVIQIATVKASTDALSTQASVDRERLLEEIRDIRAASRDLVSTQRLEREVAELRRELASRDELREMRDLLDNLVLAQRRRREHTQGSVRGALDHLRGLVDRMAEDERQ